GRPKRGGIVHAVACHRDDVTLRAQRVGDAQLRLGSGAREDELLALAQRRVELVLGHLVELRTRDDEPALPGNSDSPGDLERRLPVVAGDDDDPDPRPVTPLDGLGHAGPWRIEEPDEAEETQVALRL